jgi:carboxymethylenebutenolidase
MFSFLVRVANGRERSRYRIASRQSIWVQPWSVVAILLFAPQSEYHRTLSVQDAGVEKASHAENMELQMKYVGLILSVVSALVVSAHAASAQDWARAQLQKSPRHPEWVTVKHDGRSLETFVVYPESKDKRPVVLVIHEIFGMTDWVEDLADQVAAAGYIAVAPDLLSGMGPNGGRSSSFAEGKTMEAVSHLNPDQVTADLNAAADYGLKLPASSGKLFVAGFCWGGSQSFRFATNRSDLSAAFVFYGGPPDKDAIARIKAPVYGFYAGDDARIGATVPGTIEQMKAAAKTFEPVTYDGAGHGFMRAGEAPDANDANKKARADAWARWKTVLAK